MTFEQAKNFRDQIEAALASVTAKLNSYPKSAIGLTSDAVKASPEWKAQYAECNMLMARLRAFNGHFVKTFKSELAAERQQRRAA